MPRPRLEKPAEVRHLRIPQPVSGLRCDSCCLLSHVPRRSLLQAPLSLSPSARHCPSALLQAQGASGVNAGLLGETPSGAQSHCD